jgi:hypothetical protein
MLPRKSHFNFSRIEQQAPGAAAKPITPLIQNEVLAVPVKQGVAQSLFKLRQRHARRGLRHGNPICGETHAPGFRNRLKNRHLAQCKSHIHTVDR